MLERLRAEWCRQFHNSISWPVHGYYTCKTCHHAIRVPWEEPGNMHAVRRDAEPNWLEAMAHAAAQFFSKPILQSPVVCAVVSRVDRRLRHR